MRAICPGLFGKPVEPERAKWPVEDLRILENLDSHNKPTLPNCFTRGALDGWYPMGFWWWPVDNHLWIHDSGMGSELARQLACLLVLRVDR